MNVRRVWLAFLALAFLAEWSATVRADDKSDKASATGSWKWSFTGQNGQTRETTCKLKQDGDKLTGSVSGRNNQQTDIENGKVKDGEVSFDLTREFNGQKRTQHFTGKISGDEITGKIEFERNGEKQSRDWKATRQKEAS